MRGAAWHAGFVLGIGLLMLLVLLQGAFAALEQWQNATTPGFLVFSQSGIYDVSSNFTANHSYSLGVLTAKLVRYSAYTTGCNFTVQILGNTGGLPNATVYGTSTARSSGSIGTTTPTDYNFTFATPVSIVSGTTYNIVMNHGDCPVTDANDNLNWSVNSAATYRTGYRTSGAWAQYLADYQAYYFLYSSSLNTTYTFNAIDLYTNGALDGVNFTTANGSCVTSGGTCTLNFVITAGTLAWNATKAGYFNASGTIAANGTSSANMSMGAWNVTGITRVVDSASLNGSNGTWTVTTLGGRNFSGANLPENVYLTNGTNALILSYAGAGGYYNKSFSVNVSAPQNGGVVVSDVYNAGLNLSIKNSSGSFVPANVSVNASNGWTTSFTSGAAVYVLNLTQGYSYSVFVNASGYAYDNQTMTLSSPSSVMNFSLYTVNSISFSFYDEETFATINWTTVYLEIISPVFSANYTTTNGTKYLDLLTPTTYQIRYSAAGYANRLYSLTLVDNYHYALNLSLLNLSAATNVTVQVSDLLGNVLANATVKILKYDVVTNSFVLNQVVVTNYAGETQAAIVLNDEFYEFFIEYGGATVYTTEPTYIYSSPVSFRVPITGTGFESFFARQNLLGNLSVHDYTLHSSTFTWDDLNGVASQGCVVAYLYPDLTITNSSCGAGAAGSVTVGVSNATQATYLLKGYVVSGGETFYLASDIVSYSPGSGAGTLGVFLGVIIFLVVLGLGFWNLVAAVVLGSVAPLLLQAVGLLTIGWVPCIAILLVGLVIAYIIGKGGS
jgi:hypothetical protein